MNALIKPVALSISFSALATPVTHADSRHAGAHVHGVNQLQIVQQGRELLVTYTLPAGQFREANEMHEESDHDEHEHEHEHEHEQHEAATPKIDHETEERLMALKNHEQLFSASEISSQCRLTNYHFELHAVVTDKDDPHAGHKDAILEYQFNCSDDLTLSAIEINALKEFNNLERVDFEGLIDGAGTTASIVSDNPRVEF